MSSRLAHMPSLWGTRRGDGRKNPFNGKGPQGAAELSIPTHFRCPISLEMMRDPVTLPTGITYDRPSIETWLDMGNETCPVTNQAVAGAHDLIIPNHAIRRMIQDWCVAHRKYGVERIPTPRIPVTPTEVLEMLTEVASGSRLGDEARCRELVGKIRALGKESERNRLCIVSNGAAGVLAAAFGAFSRDQTRGSSCFLEVKEEILSALTGMFPLEADACSRLGSPESLRAMVGIAKNGSLAGRFNAVLVVKELVHVDKALVDVVADTDGMAEALVKLIREPISPQATKASLVAVFYLVSSNHRTAARFVDMGLVPPLLDILVDSEKSMTEKALGVLDALCSCQRGRQAAYEHALAVPVLVKKIFRASDMATEFSVSTLWKLGKNYRSEGEREGRAGCLAEALQVGAFQKLLLLLQVGCGEATKEKASDLLKVLNSSRGRQECIDSLDFKGLKRPFV